MTKLAHSDAEFPDAEFPDAEFPDAEFPDDSCRATKRRYVSGRTGSCGSFLKFIGAILFLSVAGGRDIHAQPAAGDRVNNDAFAINTRLGQGINLGNMLESPSEGDWGAVFHDDYARIIRNAGFQHVRLPVRWSAHTSDRAPFRIDPRFMKRVQHVVDTCLRSGLLVVMNVHHFDEMYAAPEQHQVRLIAIWRQIASKFRNASDDLVFELLNEPRANLTEEKWNLMIPALLSEIRPLHPRRAVIIGPGSWNAYHALESLQLPQDDRMLIATVHYYHPFEFTHQGVEFLENAPPAGRTFPTGPKEIQEVKDHFAQVRRWAVRNQRPVYVGEFGVNTKVPPADRERWIRTIASESMEQGFSFAYWEFCSVFGIWNADTRVWNSDLLRALSVSAQAARPSR